MKRKVLLRFGGRSFMAPYSIFRMAILTTTDVLVTYPNAKERLAGAGYLPITGQRLPLL